MKKPLSLLSVLTISGSSVPTVIVASSYQKEENIINYQQTNNLEILNRNKRENNNKPIIIDSYQNDLPIIYNVNYSNYRSMWANWSTDEDYSDYSSSYLVIDYINYAETFDKFVEKYPNVTIKTNGKAVSQSTFGDVGKGKFGTLHFDTITFNNDNIKYIKLVNAYDSLNAAYSISVKIGLGFQKIGSKLYLIPFIDGDLLSIGAYTRYLDFGLTVNSITFNSKKEIIKLN